MRYLFFDTAVNGYYTLTVLKNEMTSYLPLIGKEENISDDVAPFLFEVNDEKLAQFLSTEHISFTDILYLESKETLAANQAYFSRFIVQTIEGQEFYFRFWSATVFKKYIVTCNLIQLADFFKIVDKFSCEDKGQIVQFSFNGRKLIIEQSTNTSVLSDNKEISPSELNTTVQNNDKLLKRKEVRKFFT